MSQKKPITPEGYQKLEHELQDLWRIERPRIVQEVTEAAAHGDRSENAEYKYGKRRLREIDRRMRYLRGLLEDSLIIDPSKVVSEQIQFGATVELSDGEETPRVYQLVGVEEADVKAGRISMASPVGKALLGKKVGDVVTVKRPAGELELEVVEIRYA